MASVLGYWAMRGIAQPIRLLLAYTETEYEDKRYDGGVAPDYNRGEWGDDKENLGLDFPNLPYYIDGDLKITQSSAIIRHLARKHNLSGTTEEEITQIDMIEHCIIDFRTQFAGLCYNPKYTELIGDYKKDVVERLERFEKYLGDKKYMVGEKLTFVDFMIYEILDQHKIFDKELIEPCKKLKEFMHRIEAIPSIAAYKKSDECIVRPINNAVASFK